MIYGDEVCNEMDCWVVTCYLTIKYNLEYSNGANIFFTDTIWFKQYCNVSLLITSGSATLF